MVNAEIGVSIFSGVKVFRIIENKAHRKSRLIMIYADLKN